MNGFNIKLNELHPVAKHLQENGCAFQYYEDDYYNGHTIKIRNKELINFANCSYLGLETHPVLIEGSINAVRKYGTQNSMSRAMLSSPLYKELQENLCRIFPGYPVVFPSTTLSHCSALPLLIQKDDAIILDAYVHNSVRMASQLCKANGTFVVLAKHNDMQNVKYLIYRLQKEGYKNIWYCADGVYSIHGNLCDVKGLQKLLDEEKNFFAYIDDAHGMGWCGKNGCGYVIGNYGLHKKMIVAVSFNKSFAASGGGLIIPDEEIAEMIKFTGQTMIFSGPINPPMQGVFVASTQLHLSAELNGFQEELLGLIQYFRNKSADLNLPIVTIDNTPIQLLRIGGFEKTFHVLLELIKEGFFPMTAMYPAIAKGDDGIRVTLTRHLTTSDIDGLLQSIKKIL
jgi:7-keto-8-aminopelargonate synthetase-like enzyme